MSDDESENEEVYDIREFQFEDMPPSCTWIIIAPPGTGKSAFLNDLAYQTKHRYPAGKFYIGVEDEYEKWKNRVPPLYVSNKYSEEEFAESTKRQKKCAAENGDKHPDNYSIEIFDDIADDPKIFRNKLWGMAFKYGSQHYHRCLVIATQYAMEFPPIMRRATSFVALGREPEDGERKKLFDQFGGILKTRERFDKFMDELTGDHTFLIFVKRIQSNNIEDCVFFYRTRVEKDGVPTKWKFGCKELHKSNNERYDKNYKEEIEI